MHAAKALPVRFQRLPDFEQQRPRQGRELIQHGFVFALHTPQFAARIGYAAPSQLLDPLQALGQCLLFTVQIGLDE
jgi:hypothetical protein